MSKWNNINNKETRMFSYFSTTKSNSYINSKRIELMESISLYLKETKDYEICNAIRGLIHGANVSNSYKIETLLANCINTYCFNEWYAESQVKNDFLGRNSFIDLVLINKISKEKIYCEIKNGGLNHTFSAKHKASDYIERFTHSGCDKFFILTMSNEEDFSYWDSFVKNYVCLNNAECLTIGSDEFLSIFKGFDKEYFYDCTLNNGKEKIIENIDQHILTLKSIKQNQED